MSYEQAKHVFGHGSALDKIDGNMVYSMEELYFFINLKNETMRVKGVILIRNSVSGIIERLYLLTE